MLYSKSLLGNRRNINMKTNFTNEELLTIKIALECADGEVAINSANEKNLWSKLNVLLESSDPLREEIQKNLDNIAEIISVENGISKDIINDNIVDAIEELKNLIVNLAKLHAQNEN